MSRVTMLVHNDMRSDARVMREASALASAGWPVTVLCLRGKGLPDNEERDGYMIRRVAESSSAGWRVPLRKVRQLRQRTRDLVEAGIAEKPAIVHCHDTDTLQAGRRVANATGAHLVYDAHELFPDMIAGHGRNSRFVQHYWRRVEKKLVARSSAVITVSDSLAHVLQERYGVQAVAVRNVSNLEPLKRSDRLRRELGIRTGVPIVLYQGGLIGGRALVRLVRAMSSVPGAVLVFQGAGPEETAIRREIESRGIAEQVMLTGWVHPSELHEYACSADVGVVIYENTSLNNYNASPNKLYGYLMAGLPMVASDFPGLREVVVGESVGTVFDPADEASIAAAIRRLLDDSEALARMSSTARLLAETRYNWDVESRKLFGVYESLSGHAK